MSREIEFRAIKHNEKTPRRIVGINWMDKTAIFDISGSYETHKYKLLEQFTGLYDKNGEEIYEGDIVLYDDYHRIKMPVEFINGSFKTVSKDGDLNGEAWDFNLRYMKEYEIIGNIHMNADLLK